MYLLRVCIIIIVVVVVVVVVVIIQRIIPERCTVLQNSNITGVRHTVEAESKNTLH